jgi:purine-binding chemotaxis protein CheW
MGALTPQRHELDQAAEFVVDSSQYLTFQLSGETFAIGILSIKEILEYVSLTQVPLMPAFIRGVMNLRGSVVPVIDLSLRFGREKTVVAHRTCIVIIEVASEGQTIYIGALVDTVHEVLAIPDSEIEPSPQFGCKIRADFLAGMAKVEDRFVMLLNVDKVLSEDEMALLTEMKSEHLSDKYTESV